MTIIKDQLIEAQLEVIDNASLPSGRPVGSVYYNKTTEKIQTVKQDGNLRNVFYEDEINYPVVPTIQYKEMELPFDLGSTGVARKVLEFNNLKVNTYYKYSMRMGIFCTIGVKLFSWTVNNNTTSNQIGTNYGGEVMITPLANSSISTSDSRIFYTGANTDLVLWAHADTGSYTVTGSYVSGATYRPTFMTLEQLQMHTKITGNFT